MKIPEYEGKRFFLVGPAKYPGRCSVSGIQAGVNELWLLKDQKAARLMVIHRQELVEYCLKNDPPRQGDLFAAADKEKQREETLRQLARIQEMLSRKK